jgi:hypothetical protein
MRVRLGDAGACGLDSDGISDGGISDKASFDRPSDGAGA